MFFNVFNVFFTIKNITFCVFSSPAHVFSNTAVHCSRQHSASDNISDGFSLSANSPCRRGATVICFRSRDQATRRVRTRACRVGDKSFYPDAVRTCTAIRADGRWPLESCLAGSRPRLRFTDEPHLVKRPLHGHIPTRTISHRALKLRDNYPAAHPLASPRVHLTR